jgi:hypothetical protein
MWRCKIKNIYSVQEKKRLVRVISLILTVRRTSIGFWQCVPVVPIIGQKHLVLIYFYFYETWSLSPNKKIRHLFHQYILLNEVKCGYKPLGQNIYIFKLSSAWLLFQKRKPAFQTAPATGLMLIRLRPRLMCPLKFILGLRVPWTMCPHSIHPLLIFFILSFQTAIFIPTISVELVVFQSAKLALWIRNRGNAIRRSEEYRQNYARFLWKEIQLRFPF